MELNELYICSQVTEIRDVTSRRIAFVGVVMQAVLAQAEEITEQITDELKFLTPFIRHYAGV
jgi:hypothetical protein